MKPLAAVWWSQPLPQQFMSPLTNMTAGASYIAKLCVNDLTNALHLMMIVKSIFVCFDTSNFTWLSAQLARLHSRLTLNSQINNWVFPDSAVQTRSLVNHIRNFWTILQWSTFRSQPNHGLPNFRLAVWSLRLYKKPPRSLFTNFYFWWQQTFSAYW